MDSLIVAGRQTFEEVDRRAIYRRIDEVLAQELPMIVLCRYPLTFAAKEEVAGVESVGQLGLQALPLLSLISQSI